MGLSKEAQEAKPKKPLNTYLRFYTNRIAELGGAEDRVTTVKKEWKALSQQDQNILKREVDKEMIKYQEELEKWRKKFNVSAEDEKRKSKAKKNQKDEEEDEEEPKPRKSKGDRKKKESIPETKSKEKSVNKDKRKTRGSK